MGVIVLEHGGFSVSAVKKSGAGKVQRNGWQKKLAKQVGASKLDEASASKPVKPNQLNQANQSKPVGLLGGRLALACWLAGLAARRLDGLLQQIDGRYFELLFACLLFVIAAAIGYAAACFGVDKHGFVAHLQPVSAADAVFKPYYAAGGGYALHGVATLGQADVKGVVGSRNEGGCAFVAAQVAYDDGVFTCGAGYGYDAGGRGGADFWCLGRSCCGRRRFFAACLACGGSFFGRGFFGGCCCGFFSGGFFGSRSSRSSSGYGAGEQGKGESKQKFLHGSIGLERVDTGANYRKKQLVACNCLASLAEVIGISA